MIPLTLFLLAAAATSAGVAAKLTVANPIAAQLPLIARVGTPYNWTLSPATFVSSGQSLTYSASNLPSWLSFDSATLTLTGQPVASDKGDVSIKITAADAKATGSSTFTLPVKAATPPAPAKPFAPQFLPNPSLASVFPLRNGSALATGSPTLRVPPQWSFSVGFDGHTFTGPNDVFYAALSADGTPLPSWLAFSSEDITFNGITPPAPTVIRLALIATDVKGYRAATLPFDLVIAAHELSLETDALPTINVTAQATFSVSLGAPADFAGALFDGAPLDPANLTSLGIDVSSAGGWLAYDNTTRVLSGTPPADFRGRLALPASLTAAGNQTITTVVALDVAPPFFSNGMLSPLTVHVGQAVHYGLASDFSLPPAGSSDIELSAKFDAGGVNTSFLSFDPMSGTLAGTVPGDFTASMIGITFVAYSQSTHSTSHAALSIHIPDARPAADIYHAHPHNLRAVWITSAALCALLLCGLLLALMRRFGRVPDSAVTGPESVRGFSIEDKRWYGLEDEKATPSPQDETAAVPTLLVSAPPSTTAAAVRKADFVVKLRASAKAVTDTVRSVGGAKRVRPAISRPMPVDVPADVESGSTGFDLVSYATTQTDRRSDASSLPRRRADFMPAPLARTASIASGSTCSDASEEAVVQTAARARSVRSIQRLSDGSIAGPPPAVPQRPRLVPFTSETRVPQPHMLTPRAAPVAAPLARMSSQRAVVVGRETLGDLALGASYVRAWGEDADASSELSAAASDAGTARFSAGSYSLASSKCTARELGARALARVGERFKLRMPVAAGGAGQVRVRLASGGELPRFVEVRAGAEYVELGGVPGAGDVGEYELVAVDGRTGARLGAATLEVVNRI